MAACRMEQENSLHQPVLCTEVMTHFALRVDGNYIDATFGRGGHARAILAALSPHGHLLAIDQDPAAVAYARDAFINDPRFTIEHASFAELGKVAARHHLTGKIDGILLDLGVSSPQLDEASRGFSFMRMGPLDMRMDNSQGIDAATWLAQVDEKELARVLWVYGEERYSRRIAKAIVAQRRENPITTTTQLAELIAAAHPNWQPGRHPATRSFQAIRMAVNHELESLETALAQSLEVLAPGGRLLVISFHSLEDRLVKQFMRHETHGAEMPRGLPIKYQANMSRFKSIGRAIRPTDAEVSRNMRARSATLRVGEKIR